MQRISLKSMGRRSNTQEVVKRAVVKTLAMVAEQLGSRCWSVLSATQPNLRYTVIQQRDGRLLCNCISATYRRQSECKHVEAVRARIERECSAAACAMSDTEPVPARRGPTQVALP